MSPRHSGLVLAALSTFALLLLLGCDHVPKDSYAWHPELLKTKGRMRSFVTRVKPGKLVEYHTNDPDDPGLDFEMRPPRSGFFLYFPTPDDSTLSYSAGFWDAPWGTFAVYLGLEKSDDPVVKQQVYSGNILVDARRMRREMVTQHVRELKGILPSGSNCRLFEVLRDGTRSQIFVVGQQRNLHLEIAVTCYDKRPCSVTRDASKPPLSRLVRIHREVGLGVCDFSKLGK